MTVMRLATANFTAGRPDVQVTLLPSLGSSGGIRAVAAGAIEMAVSGRHPEPHEAADGLNVTYLGKTPFVFAVQTSSSTTGITTHELAEIFAGRMTQWPEGGDIRLVLRPLSDVDSVITAAISPELASLLPSALKRSGVPVAMTDSEAADLLESIPGSFGSTTLNLITTEQRRLRPLAFNGVQPSLANLASGTYPLAKEFFVITGRQPNAATRDLLAYLLSEPVRRHLAEWNVLGP